MAGDLEIIVIDRDDRHVYQPGLLFVPFGTRRSRSELVRSRQAQLRAPAQFRIAEIDHVDTTADTVHLADGELVGIRRAGDRDRCACCCPRRPRV